MTQPRALLPLLARSVAAALAFGLMAGAASAQGAPPKPSGNVQLQSVQAGYIGMASAGHGVLRFGGRSYKFQIGGLGAGGIGFSEMQASGKVYHLTSASDFEGAYGQARMGWAIGRHGRGKLWLHNANASCWNSTPAERGLP